jgi:tetratricopeptide (TPR) repeat protein
MMVSKVISASLVAYTVILSTGSVAEEAPAGSAGVYSKSANSVKMATVRSPKSVSWTQSMQAGRYQDATNALSRIIADKGTPVNELPMAYLNRALAHQQLRQHKQAVADYGKALSLDALSPKVRAIALYNRGLANRKLKRPASAIEDFTSSLFLNTKFSHAYYSRANVMRSIGRHELALEDYKHALTFGYPKAYLPNYGIAVTYDAMKEPAQARQALSKVLEIKPGFKPALQRYAELAGEPYHSNKPSTSNVLIANSRPNVAKSKIVTEPHQPNVADVLPQAALPPKSYLAASRQGEANGVDNLVTASIGDAPNAATLGISPDKLEYRFPGFEGSTAPVPDKSPDVAKLKNQPEKNVTITPVAAQHKAPTNKQVIAVEPKRGKVRVASLGSVVPELPEKSVPKVNVTGWLVQINSQRTEKAANSTWKKLKLRHKKALGGENVVFQRADLGKKGIYWRVRLTGFEGKKEAQNKCRSLKRSRIGCFVVRVN